MKRKWMSIFSVVAICLMLLPAALRADVHDNANIFSQSAVADATQAMKKMERVHNKQLVVETFASVPDDQKEAAAQNPDEFFKQWMAARARELKVNGVYVLICMDPHHLEVGAGKNTIARGDFSEADVKNLSAQIKSALHDKDYDKALGDAVDTVERAYTANITGSAGRSTVSGGETEYSNGRTSMPSPVGTGVSFGSLICLAVGAVIIFSLIRSVFRGSNSGGYGGGGNYGGGNYPPGGQGYGSNYGGGGGFGYGGGGGGSGFGRGFLGGLLGGALGGYAADRFDHRNDQTSAGFGQNDNSGSFGGGGGGGSFDSGPSDAGQGFGDSGVGSDFGSSGGGGDSGGGGGSSSGGDF